jgi:Inner membrane component of T3SS, cytoplasmic domain
VAEAEPMVAEAEPVMAEAEPVVAEAEPVVAEAEPMPVPAPEPQPEPEPVVAEATPAPEPEPGPEPAAAPELEVEPEPGSAITEPVLSAFEVPADAAEPEPAPPQPGPEPEPEPLVSASAVEPAAQSTPDVSKTMVAWPSGAASPGPENGAPAEAGSFEEATSVIPAWQQTDPNLDSKRTVSLQAMPPEEIASGSGFAALLTFESGPFAGRIVALPSQMVSIGRAPDNDVVVGDPATSGHHGRIDVRSGSFWISDLGSTNGTLVNGEPVLEKQLTDGDMIAIGQNTLRFTLEA